MVTIPEMVDGQSKIVHGSLWEQSVPIYINRCVVDVLGANLN